MLKGFFMCGSMEAILKKRLMEQTVNYIIRLMDEMGLTGPQSMDFCRVPEEERPKYEALVEEKRAAQVEDAIEPC